MNGLLSDEAYLAQRSAPEPGEALYLHLSDLASAIRGAARAEPGDRVLDFGCGGSPYRAFFGGARYDRADFEAAPGIEFAIGADGTIGAESDDYDIVLSTQVLEHVDDAPRYLAECRRVLRGGGTLLLSTHGTFEDHPCPRDFRRWTSEGLCRDLAEAGFEVQAVRKLTTNGRALAFLLRTRAGSLAFRTSPSFGWLFSVVAFILRRFARPFDRWCDRHLAGCRVVDSEIPSHGLYIGLLAVAVKRP